MVTVFRELRTGSTEDLTARMILNLAEESGRLVLTDPKRFPPERVTAFAERILAAIVRAEPRR